MLTISEIKHTAIELITICGSEVEMLKKTEKLQMAIVSGSESYKLLGNIKSRLHRLLSQQIKGGEPIEYYDSQFTKIHNSLLEIVSKLKLTDIHTPFEHDPHHEISYLFQNLEGELIYKFIGDLSFNKPNGTGVAKYPNGDYFEGCFKQGLREGPGKLFDKNHRLIKQGVWNNDRYVTKDGIDYFPDIAVAASVIKGTYIIPMVREESRCNSGVTT